MPRPDSRSVEISDRIRFQHMLDAARHIILFTRTRSRQDFDADPMLTRAVLHAVQEIGEAASRISDPGRIRAPDLPWKKIVGMRHRLVHVYWGINLDQVWEVVARDLDPLIDAIERATHDWPLPPDD